MIFVDFSLPSAVPLSPLPNNYFLPSWATIFAAFLVLATRPSPPSLHKLVARLVPFRAEIVVTLTEPPHHSKVFSAL